VKIYTNSLTYLFSFILLFYEANPFHDIMLRKHGVFVTFAHYL